MVSVSAAVPHDIHSLGALAALAKPGAVVIVQQPIPPASSGQVRAQLKSITLAGFALFHHMMCYKRFHSVCF